ncbi:hypothetical protein OG883_40240 [Streptomyces sp. NBC_01142]|uniref:hypothetical protein n=1 Tax=Streptomyces sp. NBC_01142 TaxID=2975865 RepID=UPI00224EC5E8|nr:hypothetical protein [Streptomyces sp. NBC_01142]MCX4825931.1 hypothetical protein [Streptomyces sp. NBC_01142]
MATCPTSRSSDFSQSASAWRAGSSPLRRASHFASARSHTASSTGTGHGAASVGLLRTSASRVTCR